MLGEASISVSDSMGERQKDCVMASKIRALIRDGKLTDVSESVVHLSATGGVTKPITKLMWLCFHMRRKIRASESV